jgi:hypothetical protein
MTKCICKGLVVATMAGYLLSALTAGAQTTAVNSGIAGPSVNGTHSANVVLGLPGAIAAGGDLAVGYSGGANTTTPFSPALNPTTLSPFTVEFWAKPDALTDNNVGPSPLFNRPLTGDRSGWVFFQRAPDTGWEFRMFSGNGTEVGFQVGGGTNSLTSWSHVVAVWNGVSPVLYVDGELVDDTASGPGQVYKANDPLSGSPPLSIGAYVNGANPYSGSVDDFAFYHTALSLTQIQAHYAAASSPTAGAYSSMVINDGAFVYYQNIPEPSTAGLLLVGLLGCGALKRHRSSRS